MKALSLEFSARLGGSATGGHSPSQHIVPAHITLGLYLIHTVQEFPEILSRVEGFY